MPNTDFVHLHLHTDYSLLDGAIQIKPLAERVRELGMKACAMTDHGNMFGAVSFYKEMKAADVKPLIGCEVYLAPTSRFEKADVKKGVKPYNHMILLAKDREGYHNLVRLTSRAYKEGFYRKPRIDRELLSQFGGGIIGLSACLSGVPQAHLKEGNLEAAEKAAYEFQDILGKGNYFLEIQDHKLEDQQRINGSLIELSKRTGIPLVATNDAHYLTRDDYEAHDVMLCIGTGRTVNDRDRMSFGGPEWYVRSPEEMAQIFTYAPDAVTRTLEVAEMCDLKLPLGENQLPVFPIPREEGDISIDEYFEKVVRLGYEKRRETVWEPMLAAGTLKHKLDEYQQRVSREIATIRQMGFPSYFLIVWDFIRFAKERNIPVGPGRGCLAGDVPVVLENGETKPISEVRAGDVVRTHTGKGRRVVGLHRYPVEEKLVRLRCFYGDSAGVTLTRDHKVLAERGVRSEAWRRAKARSTREARKRWQEPGGDLSWIPAGELRPGDWVFVPTPVVGESAPDRIDLADTAGDAPLMIGATHIEEARPVNTSFDYSLRDVHRRTGVSRNSLHFIARGLTPAKKNPRHERAAAAVEGYVAPRFGGLGEWREWVGGQSHTTTRISRHVKADARFYRVLGRWIADGWTRSDSDLALGLCFHSDDVAGLREATEFFESLGLRPHVRRAANGRKLTQLTVRSRALSNYWRSIFPRYRSTPETKHVPDFVLRLPVEHVLDVLAGYWSGDGSVGDNQQSKYTATTVSRTLADQIRFLAWRCGIPATLRKDVREDSRFKVQPAYVVNVAKDARLAERLGALPRATQYVWRAVEGGMLLQLRSVEEVAGVKEVFDLTVEEDHTYQTSSFAVHNSAAGSLIAYCLEITDVDPIQYDLLFERFLNPERVSMPDIDIDFCVNGRAEVINHVTQLYGRDSVCQIITFGTLASKAAIKDVGRALDMPYADVEKIAKLIPPPIRGRNVSINQALEMVPELKQAVETDPQVRKVIDIAKRLEGCARHSSVHAAGVVISPKPLEELIPVAVSQKQELTTQFEMSDLEKTGMLKMDFLGLTTLTIIDQCCKTIREMHGREIDWKLIPHDDPKTYEIFAQGRTEAVFQFESCLSGDTQISKERTIRDLYEKVRRLKAEGRFATGGRTALKLKSCYVDEGKFHNNTVLDVVSTGVRPVYRVVAEGNRTIKATADHNFLTERGWVRLGDLDPRTDKLLFKTDSYYGRRVCADCAAPLKSKVLKALRCKTCAARLTSNPSKPEAREKIGRANAGRRPWNHSVDSTNPFHAEWLASLRAGQEKHRGVSYEEKFGPERAAAMKAKLSAHNTGAGNPMYGRSREGRAAYSAAGFRRDLGHYVRSSWEADFARVLKHLEVEYQYEPRRFTLTRADGSALTYAPDFYVPESRRFYEIKGWMDERSAEKIRLFREQYPDETLAVIDKTRFAELQMRYRDLVEWECPKVPDNTSFVKIKSVTYEGEEETFDIRMRAPGNNFLANGFVVHNSGMQEICRKLKPKSIEDLSALNALYRPGPLDGGMVDDFIDRYHGRKPVEYITPEMGDILGNTYGVCVAGDTLVFDADTGGRVRIDELGSRAGRFYVQGVDEGLRPRRARMTRWLSNGLREVVEVRLRNGARVKLTPDHKVLTEEGWREVGRLRAGDVIATPRRLFVAEEKEHDRDRLRVLAYLLADGSLSSAGCTADFVSKDAALIEEYASCVRRGFERLTTSTLEQARGVTRVMVKGADKTRYHEPNALVRWLRELGLKSMRGGCRSDEKFVPEFVFGLSGEDVAFFLASLWDCDGHIAPRLCHYKTISPLLARDVQTLLLRLGIRSAVYESRYHRARRGGEVTAYQVTVYNLAAFEEWIAPHLIAKAMRREVTPRGESSDAVSRGVLLEELALVWRGSGGALMRESGVDRQHFFPKARRRPRINAAAAGKLALHLPLPRTARNLNVRWEEIAEIRPAGVEQVYDITVEGIHNFVGNNIILHNCVYQEQIMQLAQKLGGYSLGEADLMRRAMGKKKREEMAVHEEKFVQGCTRNKIPKKKAKEIFRLMAQFADYGFNRCLTGDAEVLDADTGETVAIRDIAEGRSSISRTYSFDGERVFVNEIVEAFETGEKEVVQVETEEGLTIRCTLDHKFHTDEGYLPLREIVERGLELNFSPEVAEHAASRVE